MLCSHSYSKDSDPFGCTRSGSTCQSIVEVCLRPQISSQALLPKLSFLKERRTKFAFNDSVTIFAHCLTADKDLYLVAPVRLQHLFHLN